MNSQKLERIYVAALSRIEAAEPGAETKKSTPIFLRDSDASKKEAIRDAANALGNLWMRKSPSFNAPKPVSSPSPQLRGTRTGLLHPGDIPPLELG